MDMKLLPFSAVQVALSCGNITSDACTKLNNAIKITYKQQNDGRVQAPKTWLVLSNPARAMLLPEVDIDCDACTYAKENEL